MIGTQKRLRTVAPPIQAKIFLRATVSSTDVSLNQGVRMAGKLSTSFELVKASAGVLKQDKELMIFPVISGVSAILVVATFFVPAWFLGVLETLEGGGVVGYLFMFAFYLVQYTVMFFFNTALVGAALIRLEGGDPTVADGLNIAISKLPKIVGYAAIAATVGMVLRAISERFGFVSQLVVGFIGLAWSLMTFLVVPVLVTRDIGPIDAVKESAALFKKTWGEQVVGSAGLGLAFFVMFTSWAVFAAVFFALAGAVAPVAIIPLLIVFGGGFLFLMVAASAMSGVYSAALYRYATTGQSFGTFEPALLEGAFKPKRR